MLLNTYNILSTSLRSTLAQPPLSRERRSRKIDPREQKEHIPFKKQRLTTEELENTIKDKIQKAKESIAKLKKHIGNNTCPKTLRYNARANIAPDEEFKRDIYKLD